MPKVKTQCNQKEIQIERKRQGEDEPRLQKTQTCNEAQKSEEGS